MCEEQNIFVLTVKLISLKSNIHLSEIETVFVQLAKYICLLCKNRLSIMQAVFVQMQNAFVSIVKSCFLNANCMFLYVAPIHSKSENTGPPGLPFLKCMLLLLPPINPTICGEQVSSAQL